MRILTACLALCAAVTAAAGQTISGAIPKWTTLTLTFDGPEASETGVPNPFLDYRLDVFFRHDRAEIRVPGFFAADGDAANTSADKGRRWRVHFAPDQEGAWTYRVSFRSGKNVAVDTDQKAGRALPPDGVTGGFQVGPPLARSRDTRSRGFLRYVGGRYLQFAETRELYLKGGADSPENFLGYADFDQTFFAGQAAQRREGEALPMTVHQYAPHAGDWRPGDPTWGSDKGKNIMGALNYLAGKGMNSVYFLTMNIEGDGKNVWPWTAPSERLRFDCSKLDQWDIVFNHMDRLGLLLHVITQETENDQVLDGGDLGIQRKLYYRELVARFAHHPALVWNLGEENSNSNAQRKAFARRLAELDPYDHPIVVHTYVYTKPDDRDSEYAPLLGFPDLAGPSLQIGSANLVHHETLSWISRSAASGHSWFVCLDEIGPADVGVKPDTDDPGHDAIRQQVLWGNLMAGGSGCEWYFGYKFANNDLNCEDWRSRERMWDQTRYALEFFQKFLPFAEMQSADEVTNASDDFCFAKPGAVYAVYLPHGGPTDIQLPTGRYSVRWYDPRHGGELQRGTVNEVSGPGAASLGDPPAEAGLDWVVLARAVAN